MARITHPREDEPIRLVTSRGGVRYRAVLSTGQHPDGRRRQETRTFDTLSEAREWVSETRLAVKRGAYRAPVRSTVSEVADAWLESKRDVREVTLNTYAVVLKSVRARLGAMQVSDVRRSHCDEFVSWLRNEGGRKGEGVSHRTVSLTLLVLKSVLDYAVTEGLLVANPASSVKPPRKRPQDHREPTIWTRAQLDAFVAQADQDAWAALWRLTACELRRSEVCGLQWSDVDLEAGTVTVRQGRVAFGSKSEAVDAPKSRASARTVPVEVARPGTVALLRSLRRSQAEDRLRAGEAWADSGFVFVDRLGQPIRPERYSDRFREVASEAGLPPIRLHDVRHSVATWLNEQGVAPVDAAAFGGHEVQTYLNTYVTRTQEGVSRAAQALSQGIAQAQ